jgi:uncharacterized delta-60 repeat protein
MFRTLTRSRFRFRAIAQLGALAALVLAGVAGAAGGSLDPTFGSGGTVLTAFSGGSAGAGAVVLQASGRVVAAGTTKYWFALAGYRDGHLDASFGNGGTVLTSIYGGGVSAAAIQPDGKIVVVGRDFVLARFNANGSLDPTFGNGGTVFTNMPSAIDTAAHAVAIQRDGKIVVVGFSFGRDWAIVRYNPDGSLDPTFGAGGFKFVSPLGIEGDSWASAVAIQPNGKLVVGGFTYANGLAFALIRLNANGNLDPSFGSGGALLTDMLTGMGGDSRVAALAIQPSGKIVAAGYASIRGFYSDFALARYTDNGTLDPTFGTGGKVLTDLGGTAGIASLVAQTNGRIVAGGTAGGDFAVARYTDNGSLDQTFGAGGTVLTDLGGYDALSAIVVQPNGKIVAAGSSNAHGTLDFALARYLGG